MQSPATRQSMSVCTSMRCASAGVFTIGSPITFIDVFTTTGTPVCRPNSAMRS